MNENAILVFEDLLRAGLWGTSLACRWEELDEQGWTDVLNLAHKQTVTGIVFDGLQSVTVPANLKKVFIRLAVQVLRIEQTNGILDQMVASFSEKLRENGIQAVLLKGQGIATLYPKPNHRQCGDIDLYVGITQFEKTKALFKEWGYSVEEEKIGDKHLKIIERNGVNLDIHWITTMPLSPKWDKPLRQWEQSFFYGQKAYVELNRVRVQVPPPLFNAVFLFMHLFNHFMNEGVSYRQICDWGLSLRKEDVRLNHKLLEGYIRKYDLVEPWKAFSYLAVNHLGFDAADFPLYTNGCDKKARVVLKRIYDGGNFGKYRKHKDYKHLPWLFWKIGSFWNHHRNALTVSKIFPKQYVRYYGRVWKLVAVNLIRRLKIRKGEN